MKMKRLLLATSLFAGSLQAQSLPSLTRSLVTNGLNDSTLTLVSDSARRTRAATLLQFRKALSLKGFDSLFTTNLRLTGGSITGSPTATFGAITVSSCTGCGGGGSVTVSDTVKNVTFDSVRAVLYRVGNGSAAAPAYSFTNSTGLGFFRVGADTLGFSQAGVRSLIFTRSASLNGKIIGSDSGLVFLSSTNNRRSIFFTQTVSGSENTTLMIDSARRVKMQVPGTSTVPTLVFGADSATGIYRLGKDTLAFSSAGNRSFAYTNNAGTDATIFGGLGNMTIQAGTGNSRTLTLATTTSAGTVKNTLILGADSSATFLGKIQSIRGTTSVPGVSVGPSNSAGLSALGTGTDTLVLLSSGAASVKIHGGAVAVLRSANNGAGSSFTIGSGIGTNSCVVTSATDGTPALQNVLQVCNGVVTMLNSVIKNTDGSVGAPAYQFANSTNSGMYNISNGTSDTLAFSANGVLQMELGSSGALRLPILPAEGSTKNAVCWDGTTFAVTQNAAATCTVSSRRYKTDIQPLSLDVARDAVSKLRATSYTEKSGGRKAIGVIAEEADSVDHRLASRDNKGVINSTNYEEITVLLLKVVQDQQRQLDSLKTALKTRKP